MILQALYSLYQRLEKDPEYRIPPIGYSQQKIAFTVVLTPQGDLHGLAAMPDNILDRIKVVPGGDKPTGKVTASSVHEKVCFLRNDLAFLLGATIKEKNGPMVPAIMEHEAFKKYHLSLEGKISDPAYQALCVFLRGWNPDDVLKHPEWAVFSDGQGVFQILGETEYLHDKLTIRGWWDENRPTDKPVAGQCLVTGAENQPISRLHEPKIKGVKAAQSSGAPIVSFDKDSDAYSSYGRDGAQGFNAPVSEEAVFKYANALNALLSGPMSRRHRFQLGDATTVFWTETPSKAEDFLAAFFQQGGFDEKTDAQDSVLLDTLGIFLNALRKGREAYGDLADDPDHTRFFILGLTGQAKGRIGVRFFHRDSLANLLDNLRKHYRDMELVRWTGYGKENRWPAPEFPELWRMLDETCPRRNGKADRDQIPPTLEGPLLRSVMTGQRYPDGLFEAIMRRIHADRQPNYVRCCIIKGYLTRNLGKEIDMSLNPSRTEPAYWTGCLFAALHKTQYDALGEVNASIRDRFYGAASATPQAVFPRLLRMYQHHLPKMEKGRIGREILVREIMARLQNFPAHLNLAEQGLFALGYYHQMKDLWTAKEDKNNQQEEAQ
ncbi:MAG TPA: type I-C CRISPR-associated protein Cas8c/Csd1 [Kiritimatiellia bacterium]|nr:type I-C CRISPR-associated protein Cas8c/Csd1 [Kiritimatiellia bacterium]HMO98730.1 type I-C CRISPR-associated protein Cas8c/Csd1 [Kiritimatiellia bacterium]HMP96890.1 type I-C CRISPR-associated protein Cas8c/Csd1 [Kiritimatiellia bacterium]